MSATGLFIAGAVFGVVAALTGQINPFAPWLLLTYAAFVLAMVVGGTITDPWTARLGQAATATADGGSSDELRAVVADPRARAATAVLMTVIAVIVFLMVVKPLS
jgi:hypothetical protein